jgi:hypothetical protein
MSTQKMSDEARQVRNLRILDLARKSNITATERGELAKLADQWLKEHEEATGVKLAWELANGHLRVILRKEDMPVGHGSFREFILRNKQVRTTKTNPPQ